MSNACIEKEIILNHVLLYLMLSPNINSLICLSHLFKFSFIKKYSRLFVPLLSILYWKKLIVIYVLNEPLMLNLSILFVHTRDMVLLHVPIVLLTTSVLTYSNISNYGLQGLTKILQKAYNVKFVLQNIILVIWVNFILTMQNKFLQSKCRSTYY